MHTDRERRGVLWSAVAMAFSVRIGQGIKEEMRKATTVGPVRRGRGSVDGFVESVEENGSSTMRFRLLINLIVLMGRKLSSSEVSLCFKKGQSDGVDEKWE